MTLQHRTYISGLAFLAAFFIFAVSPASGAFSSSFSRASVSAKAGFPKSRRNKQLT